MNKRIVFLKCSIDHASTACKVVFFFLANNKTQNMKCATNTAYKYPQTVRTLNSDLVDPPVINEQIVIFRIKTRKHHTFVIKCTMRERSKYSFYLPHSRACRIWNCRSVLQIHSNSLIRFTRKPSEMLILLPLSLTFDYTLLNYYIFIFSHYPKIYSAHQ